MSDESNEVKGTLRLPWDETAELLAFVRRDGGAEVAELVKIDRATGKRQSYRLEVASPLHITGLVRASERHVLVGVRSTVLCIDVVKLKETCRAREVDDDGALLEEDAIPEETLCPHGFAYDVERRMLWMLCCFFDDAALCSYQLDKRCRKFTRKSRRLVGDGCPRGSGDQLGRAGICLRPNSRDVVALIGLDNVDLPSCDGASQETGRLCWLVVFSDRSDTWIEVRSEIDEDFLDGPSVAREDGSVPAEDWEPYPVAVDEDHVALATATGKILLTDLETGDTVRLENLNQVVRSLACDASSASLQAELVAGGRATIPVAAKHLQPTGGKAGPHKTVVRARKPKRHQPPKAAPLEPAFPLSWSTASPIAITPDGTCAIAGRFVIHVPEQRTVSVLPYHWERIKQVAISKDGSRVFTNECKLRLFDGRTGELLRELRSPRQFALSPEETRIAGLDFHDVTIWDVNTGEEVLTFPCERGLAIAWSPDGKTLAVAGAGAELVDKATGQPVFGGGEWVGGESVQLWDLESGQCVRELHSHTPCVHKLAWPSEGHRIISSAIDRSIRVWDTETLECALIIQTPESHLSEIAVTHDGSRILAASAAEGEDHNYVIRIWDASTGELTGVIEGSGGPVGGDFRNAIAMTRDHRFLLADSKSLRLCDVNEGKPIGELGQRWGHSNAAEALSPDGRWLATWAVERYYHAPAPNPPTNRRITGIDHTTRLWDVESRKCIAFWDATSTFVHEQMLAVARQGSLVAGCFDTESVFVWDPTAQTCVARLLTRTIGLKAMVFSDDGRLLATGGYDKSVCVWDARSGEQLACLTGHTKPVTCLAFSTDGQRLLSGSEDKTVRLWDWKKAECLTSFRGHTGTITSIVVPADQRQVISSAVDHAIRIWDSRTGKCARILDGPANRAFGQLLLTADDQQLVARHSFDIWVWDLATGVPIKSLPGVSRVMGVDATSQVLTTVHDVLVERWSLRP